MKKWSLISERSKIIAEINITPLTDVMLVLLVIFMVTTPLLVIESFKIKLPTAVASDVEMGKGLTLSISREGVIYLNNKQVPMGKLLDAIKTELSARADKTIIIKADKNISHGVVVQALDSAKRAGAVKLSIATEPEKK